MLKKSLKAFFSLFVEIVHLTEFFSKLLGCLSLVYSNAFRLRTINTPEVHIDKKEGDSVVNLRFNIMLIVFDALSQFRHLLVLLI